MDQSFFSSSERPDKELQDVLAHCPGKGKKDTFSRSMFQLPKLNQHDINVYTHVWCRTLQEPGRIPSTGPYPCVQSEQQCEKVKCLLPICQYLQEEILCELFGLHTEILLPLILATSPLCSVHNVSLKVSLLFRSEMKWRLNTGNLRFPIQGVLHHKKVIWLPTVINPVD